MLTLPRVILRHSDGSEDDGAELLDLGVVEVRRAAQLHRLVLRSVQHHGGAGGGAPSLGLLDHGIKPSGWRT